jgi:hypothetical protein
MSYGFIITRHVNSRQTNEYWNHCVKLIRTHYPLRKIIIIDDNSNYKFVKSYHEYKNIKIIQSEYPGRGELLPYVYFLKNKWFENAVIVHDSLFFHKHIPFETFNFPVIPLWHHPYDKEHLNNLLRISSFLKNNNYVKQELMGNEINILGITIKKQLNLCFGGQCYINHNFLLLLEKKYNLSNLVNVIKCRRDRCGLERILGILFNIEYNNLMQVKSLCGEIFLHYKSFKYNYTNYISDFNKGKVPGVITKVWTGR